MHSSQGDHHGRQTLVTRRHAKDTTSGRQGPYQSPEDHRRIITVRQAVHHAGRPLRAPVARIGAESGKRDASERGQFFRRGLHQQANLPVTRVVTQGYGRTICRTDTTLGAQNEILLPVQFGRVPAHAGIL